MTRSPAVPNQTPQPELPSDWAWSNAPDDADFDSNDPTYQVLRDAVIAAFNPPDDDVAEISLMTDTIDKAWAFIVAQPCTCPVGTVGKNVDQWDSTITDYYGLQCPRCDALGRSNDVRIEQ